MSWALLKIPAIIVVGVIAFALGAGTGAVAMKAFGYQWSEAPPGPPAEVLMARAGGGSAMPASPGGEGMAGMAGRPGGGTGGGMGGRQGGGMGGRGPSARNQLASLVVKLDELTRKPLTVNLNEEQREKLREQLKGLGDKDELSDDDAKARLAAALKVVEGDRETLEDAGYRWPGQQGGAPRPTDMPNPFKEAANAEHLKSLQEQLAKGKTG